MPIDAATALAAEPRTAHLSWTRRDVLLYHLGIGAGVPATDPAELRYTLESRLHVLPSFATVAGGGKPAVTGALSRPGIDVDLARVLHGGQTLTLHRPLPAEGTATTTGRIVAVYDKGTAAVLVMRTDAADAEGPLWTGDAHVFVRGEGGWGGDRGPPPGRSRPPGNPTWSSNAACARTRHCSTACPATSTPCTPTRSSPGAPVSPGPSCTACAPTASPSRRSWTPCSAGTCAGCGRTTRGSPGSCTWETLRIRMWRRNTGDVRVTVTAADRDDATVLDGGVGTG